MEYILMHRTKEIARIELDEFSNIASIYEVASIFQWELYKKK